MSDAKFKIGQVVAFNRRKNDGHVPQEEFTVVRVMPLEGGQRSYRVQGNKDGQERAFSEEQIRNAGDAAPTLKAIKDDGLFSMF
jgi:hypothetical protein